MATAGLADIQSYSWGRIVKKPWIATGWRSPPDPIDKQIADKGQVLAQALELVSGSSTDKWPPAEQGTCLQISQTRKE